MAACARWLASPEWGEIRSNQLGNNSLHLKSLSKIYFVKINLLFWVIRNRYRQPACSIASSRRWPNNVSVASTQSNSADTAARFWWLDSDSGLGQGNTGFMHQMIMILICIARDFLAIPAVSPRSHSPMPVSVPSQTIVLRGCEPRYVAACRQHHLSGSGCSWPGC